MNEDFTINSEATINTPEDAELQSLAPQMTLCGGKFRLEKEAGRGGMGVVWKAYDTISERYVALKFVPQEIRHFDKAMEQIRLAFRTIQDLNHQNIRPVYGLEKDPGMGYFVVMKWLEGQSLDAVQLTREQKMTVLEKVAAALDYAHEHGVVHRDVKPSNIFLQMDGNQISEVFLVDFGISAEVQNSMSQHTGAEIRTSGTRAFMPPEQWRGQTQDGRTDQYSLAAVAYWLFAGRLPFHVADTQMLRDCVLLDMPDPIAGERPELNAAIMRGLAKQRDDRFKTCRELVKGMTGGTGTKQAVFSGTTPASQPQKCDEKPIKYTRPFVCYWQYWLTLIPSYFIAFCIFMCGFVLFPICCEFQYYLPSFSNDNYQYLANFAIYIIVCILHSGLYFSQIFWNSIKTHKFKILYGLPISIIGFVLTILGFVVSFLLQIDAFGRFVFLGAIIGNIVSLILFSIKEEWLDPKVWNKPSSWFRLWNLIIGWFLLCVLYVVVSVKFGPPI